MAAGADYLGVGPGCPTLTKAGLPAPLGPTVIGAVANAEPAGHSCKVWGPSAEHVAESAAKGTRVLVHGHVETETWNDRDSGEKRTRDVVVVTGTPPRDSGARA